MVQDIISKKVILSGMGSSRSWGWEWHHFSSGIRLGKKLKLRRLGRKVRLRHQAVEDASDLWSIEKLLEREALDHRRAFLFEDL